MDIFSSQAGRVTAIEGTGTPLLLEIGDDPEGASPDSNWGGYDEFRAIVTGFGVQQQGGYQFLHTLRDFIYVYVFGERIGTMTIEGVAFNGTCESASDAHLLDGGFGATPLQYHGLEYVQAYYLRNCISNRADAISIILGLDTPFTAFLTSIKWEVIDSPDRPFLGRFAMGFHMITDSGELVDSLGNDYDATNVYDSRALFTQQLQAEALTGLQPGPGV
jgi:hypothetical protein